MLCPNCGANDPAPVPSDNGTTTCPRCGHRFPIEEPVGARALPRHPLWTAPSRQEGARPPSAPLSQRRSRLP